MESAAPGTNRYDYKVFQTDGILGEIVRGIMIGRLAQIFLSVTRIDLLLKCAKSFYLTFIILSFYIKNSSCKANNNEKSKNVVNTQSQTLF